MSSKFLVLTLPLPPTLNQSYYCAETGGGVRMVLTKKAKDYKEMVEEIALITWNRKGTKIDRNTRFALRLVMILEKNSRDVDSNIKLVMDSIMSGVKAATYLDGLSDLRVFQATLEKRLVGESGGGVAPGLYIHLVPYQKGAKYIWPTKISKDA